MDEEIPVSDLPTLRATIRIWTEKAAVQAGEAMPGDEGNPELRTLADKVSWLIEHAHPVGRGPYSIGEVCFLIHKVTGEQISHTTIWKLRNGQQDNPQIRVISALACTFGVEPAFFFEGYDPAKLRQMQEQAELIALVRGADITAAEFRNLFGLDAEGRQAAASFTRRVARALAEEHDPARAEPPGAAEPFAQWSAIWSIRSRRSGIQRQPLDSRLQRADP